MMTMRMFPVLLIAFLVGAAPAWAGTTPASAFAVDAALSGCSNPTQIGCPRADGDTFAYVAEFLSDMKVPFARDRLCWRVVQPERGRVPQWGKFLKNAELLNASGTKVGIVFHDAPDWAGPKPKLPRDLLALRDFAREVGRTFGGLSDSFEFWNEEDIGFAPEPAWDYVAALKAAYIGFKEGAPDVNVLSGALCQNPQGFYYDVLFENGMADYFDVFNYHNYHPVADVSNYLGRVRAFMAKHGFGDRQLHITESGCDIEGLCTTPSSREGLMMHSPEQEEIVAEFYPKAQIAAMMEGVARNCFFVFAAYNERDGKKDWGMLRRDGSPKPVCEAMRRMIAAVGDAELLGEVRVHPQLASYAFRHPQGDTTIAYWVPTQIDVAPGVVRRYEKIETNLTFSAGGRTVTVTARNEASYVRGFGELPLVRKPRPKGVVGPKPAQADEDRTVVISVDLDKDDFSVGRRKSLAEMKVASGRLSVSVLNLSPERKRGRLKVCGGVLKGLPEELTLEANAQVVLQTMLEPHRRDGSFDVTLEIGGTFNGKRISSLRMPVRAEFEFLKSCESVPLKVNDVTRWRRNSSADEAEIVPCGEGVSLNCTWKVAHTDRWMFPFYDFKADEDTTDALYVSFEVMSRQNKVENDWEFPYIMTEWSDGSASDWLNYPSPTGDFEKRLVSLPVRPGARLVSLRFGGKPLGTHVEYFLKNVRLLKKANDRIKRVD